jgi:hypothetical protein
MLTEAGALPLEPPQPKSAAALTKAAPKPSSKPVFMGMKKYLYLFRKSRLLGMKQAYQIND